MNIKVGAWPSSDTTTFRVWAPKAQIVEVVGMNPGVKKVFPLVAGECGYFEASLNGFKDGDLYKFRIDGKTDLPDPASRYQPEGPHGPSQIVAEEFPWTDQSWKGIPLEDLIVYELHVGTFSPEGTFSGIQKRIPHFKKLGINTIEIMPIGQFAGKRNWGYDGVAIFATHSSYGTVKDLKELINECHKDGIAVLLDVVYNHMGPEGNYLSQWGTYFQDKYKTPWGEALNYDGLGGDEVRNYFLQNARQWLEEFHFDGLRLDATHAIFDTSAVPFLEQLSDLAKDLERKLHRTIYLIAENENNDPRILQDSQHGGWGLTGQWADDLHHVIHTTLTKETQGYYEDFGTIQQFADCFRKGILYENLYSLFRQRHHGRSYENIDRRRLVVCSQNHDQIGNRKLGDRLISLTDDRRQRLAAATVFLSGCMPLIFMGEEWGAKTPFQYFVDHTDKNILKATQEGRKNEFAAFGWNEDVPDPGSEKTFLNSKLDWEEEASSTGQSFEVYYRRLIDLSKKLRRHQLMNRRDIQTRVNLQMQTIEVLVNHNSSKFELFFNLSEVPVTYDFQDSSLEGLLDSSNPEGHINMMPSLVAHPYSVLVAGHFARG